jgi:uncharacterized repeat protein (TIGR03803 family)
MQASNGKLYGMTSGGGIGAGGVIFSFDLSSSIYKKLQDFGINKTGSGVTGSLLYARNRKLYGMTTMGGSMGRGVIFSFDPFTYTYKKLKDFDNTNGANPEGGLIQAKNGKLYGTTRLGGKNNWGELSFPSILHHRFIQN